MIPFTYRVNHDAYEAARERNVREGNAGWSGGIGGLKVAGIEPGLFVISCPNTLNDSSWQKKKGKVGKMVKTGLGDELKKVEALLKKVDVVALDPSSIPSKSVEELKVRVDAAKKEYQASVVPLQKQLKAVRDKAEEAVKKLKKMPLGGDAAKAAAQIAKDADVYSVTCKSLDLEGAVKKVMADIQKKNELAAKHLKASLAKFAQGAKTYLGDPTKESWETNIKQQGRSVSNSVAQLQNYRVKFWTDFEKFKGFDAGTLGFEDSDFSDKGVKLVKAAIGQVKDIAAFKG